MAKQKDMLNEKKKFILQQINEIFMNGSFLSLLFFSSHRDCNEVINPISVGIGPFRLFWLR